MERYNPIAVAPHDEDPFGAMETDSEGGFVLYEDYAALSDALEAERASHTATLKDAQDECAHAEALDAKLREAALILDYMLSQDSGEIDISLARKDARAFLASIEGDKP